MRLLLLVTLASGCGFGLDSQFATPISAPSFADAGEASAEEEDGLPSTAVALEGRLYTLEAADMEVLQPPGLDGLWDQVLTRPLLVYVSGESSATLRLDAALGTPSGEQDPCEAVRHFPEADWTQNPVFDAGPGVLETSFAGHSATFREVQLSGVVDEYGFGWRDGTLTAVLDTRELRAALGGVDDVCALVESLGGECFACSDGEPACFDLEIGEVTAHYSEASFDPTPSSTGCE